MQNMTFSFPMSGVLMVCMTLYCPTSEYVCVQATFQFLPSLEDVAMPIAAEYVFLSKKCLNDTDADDISLKSTGVVMMRDTPTALGLLLNFNSLANFCKRNHYYRK